MHVRRRFGQRPVRQVRLDLEILSAVEAGAQRVTAARVTLELGRTAQRELAPNAVAQLQGGRIAAAAREICWSGGHLCQARVGYVVAGHVLPRGLRQGVRVAVHRHRYQGAVVVDLVVEYNTFFIVIVNIIFLNYYIAHIICFFSFAGFVCASVCHTHDIDVTRHTLTDANVLLLALLAIIAVPGRATVERHRRTGILAVLAQAQPLQIAVALVQAVTLGAIVAAPVV